MVQDYTPHLFSVSSFPDGRWPRSHVSRTVAEGDKTTLILFRDIPFPLGTSYNPMVGCTVACAVDVAQALNKHYLNMNSCDLIGCGSFFVAVILDL